MIVKSIYIHIPFCDNICSYCDFSKVLYKKEIVSKYLYSLKNEIDKYYNNELINTLYIGGGTPSCLSVDELEKLFDIIMVFKRDKNMEFSFECNPENMNEEKIKLLADNGVNRVSIGVQSFDEEKLRFLKRSHNKSQVISLIDLFIRNNITNINLDMMFGINFETKESIKNDLDIINKLPIKHISYYSLILEPNTALYVEKYPPQDEDVNRDIYDYICSYLKKIGYIHYEISNFMKDGFESKHNLTYWNNDVYYGFGSGSHGYIDGVRYANTRSITKYINNEYKMIEDKIDMKTNMENEIILGFRKIKGINKDIFYKKYKKGIYDVFDIAKYINKGMLVDDGRNIYISQNYIYISNEILVGLLESN